MEEGSEYVKEPLSSADGHGYSCYDRRIIFSVAYVSYIVILYAYVFTA